MRESGQSVRHGDPVQPCLIRSHPGPEHRREPDSVSMEYPLVHEHMARDASQDVIQDKPPPHLLPFASYFAGVMQDKDTPNFVARICTTPFTPLVTGWCDMYSIYTFFW